MKRLIVTLFILNLISVSLIRADSSLRLSDPNEEIILRKERQVNVAGFNSFANILNFFLQGFQVLTPSNTSVSNTTSFALTPGFFNTLLSLLQYLTFLAFFAGLLAAYGLGIAFLYLFSMVGQNLNNRNFDNQQVQAIRNDYNYGSSSYGSSGYSYNMGVFRSFEDENLPLFEKITSVGYGVLDRSSELYNLVQTPSCMRFMVCHMSSTFGDQEANGFLFKDLLRNIASTLDSKAKTDGMQRAVNVGLLTGECDEPAMTCPELVPYFKKMHESVSNYL